MYRQLEDGRADGASDRLSKPGSSDWRGKRSCQRSAWSPACDGEGGAVLGIIETAEEVPCRWLTNCSERVKGAHETCCGCPPSRPWFAVSSRLNNHRHTGIDVSTDRAVDLDRWAAYSWRSALGFVTSRFYCRYGAEWALTWAAKVCLWPRRTSPPTTPFGFFSENQYRSRAAGLTG
jgi:hypothetical protein